MPYFGNKKPYRKNVRADHKPGARAEFDRNKKRLLMSQDVCALCGKPIDKTLKYPDPGAPVVDHIIPLNKGGHPCAMDNLQLTHARCNRLKGDSIKGTTNNKDNKKNNPLPDNYYSKMREGLPQYHDWTKYKPQEE